MPPMPLKQHRILQQRKATGTAKVPAKAAGRCAQPRKHERKQQNRQCEQFTFVFDFP